jgi:hypothetical protein
MDFKVSARDALGMAFNGSAVWDLGQNNGIR